MFHFWGAGLVCLPLLTIALSAQTPTGPFRLTLENVVITNTTTPGGTHTVTFDRSFTASNLTVTGSVTEATRGSAPFRFTFNLTNTNFTAINISNSIARLTPDFAFEGSISITPRDRFVLTANLTTNASGTRSCLNVRSDTAETFSRCVVPFVGHTTVAGRNFILVRNELIVAAVGARGSAALRVDSYYSYEPPREQDTLEIVPGSLRPAPPQLRTDRATFAARARYNFTSFSSAWVALRLYDKAADGTLLASSDLVAATRPSGENDLEIRDFVLKEDTPATVYLQCVLINRATEAVVLRTIPVAYEWRPNMSVAPPSLRLTGAERGKASALTASLDITNSGGGALDWRIANALVNLTPTGNAVGTARVRLTPAQGTGLATRQTARVNVEIDTVQVTRGGTFTGSVTIDSTTASSVTVQVEVVVIEPVGMDAVSLSSIVPGAGSLPARSSQRFSALVRYTLASAATGTVTLELYSGNTLLRRSDSVGIQSGTNEVGLVIPEFTLPDGLSQLSLKGVLRANAAVVESSGISYTVSNDTIEILSAITPLWADLPTPKFYVTVNPRLAGSTAAKAVAVLSELSGREIARSQETRVERSGRLEIPFNTFTIPAGLGAVVATVSLIDAGGRVSATSEPFRVAIEAPPVLKIELGDRDVNDWQPLPLPVTLGSPRLLSHWPARLGGAPDARLIWDRGEPAELEVQVIAIPPGPNRPVTIVAEQPAIVTPLTAEFSVPDVPLIRGTENVDFVGYFSNSAGAKASTRVRVPVESVTVYPAAIPVELRIGPPRQEFRYKLRYHSVESAQLRRVVQIFPTPASGSGLIDSEVRRAPASQLAAVPDVDFEDVFDAGGDLEPGTKEVSVRYYLRRLNSTESVASSEKMSYTRFQYPPSIITRGVDALIEFGSGQIANARTTVVNKIVQPKVKQEAFDFLKGAGNPLIKAPGRPGAALFATPGFLGIQRTWEFTPIPADGTFSGDLILQYDPQEFPDHPDFDEAKLRIVSFDADTGQVTALPTTLDPVKRTATTRLDRLAAAYTLAVPGPFENALLTAAVSRPSATLVLTNTGSTAADATVGDRSLSIPASGQVTAPLTGETSVRTSARTAGVAILGGSILESVDLTKSAAGIAVLPDILRGPEIITEIHLANASNFAVEARLGLWNSDGSEAGVAIRTLEPKARSAQPVQSLFPDMPEQFTGYMTLELQPGISAGALLVAGGSAAVVAAQSIPAPERVSTRLYSPYLSLGPAALNLVNPTSLDAAATVTALAPNGAPLAPAVDIRLPAGTQDRRTVAAIFGLNPDTAAVGAIRIDSTVRGIVGSVVFEDPLFGTRFRTAVPLDLEPSRTWLIPYVSNAAGFASTVVLHNTTSTAATVQVRLTAADGALLGAAAAQLVANGSRRDPLATLIPASAARQGYLTMTADQPVIPVVLFARADGSGDIAAILPQPAPSTTGPAPGTGALSAAPVDFGSVAVGQSRDLAAAVRNNGTSAVTITTLASSNPRFSVVSPNVPFTIAAGATQQITVRFTPTAAGTQSGTLTVAGNDPALGLTVALTGSGTSLSGPRIEVSPASLNFGSIAPGTQATRSLTIRNTGTGLLTINAITVAFWFEVVGVNAPVSIPQQGSVTWNLRFSPDSPGAYAGTLSIVSNDPANPTLRVSLTGTASLPGSAQLSACQEKRSNQSCLENR